MPFSDRAQPLDSRGGSRLAEAATRALQSARPQGTAKQIRVPSWLVAAFVAERDAAAECTGAERAPATDAFLQGVHNAAVQFAGVHGYGALALLTSRRQDRLSELRKEYQRAVRREVERAALPFIARIADGDEGDVVVLDDQLVQNSLTPQVRIIQTFDFDEDRPDETLPVHGLVVAARTPESAEWEGDYPGDTSRGPVPVSAWVRGRVSSDPAFDPDDWADDDLTGSLDRFTQRAAEHLGRLARELDAVEVEAAIAANVLDHQLTLSPSGTLGLTAVEADTLRMRHRRALLITSGPFFLAAVAELRRSGRATSVNAAFELLERECADGSGESVRLAYSSTKSTDNALIGLGTNSVALDEHGYEALLGPKGLKDYERAAIDSVRDLLEILG